jgi:sugar lactone lactonase YvrE
MTDQTATSAFPFQRGLVAALLLFAVHGQAAELRFAGVLGNSGESGSTLATFAGQAASGMGPVLDDANAIWERGGSRQLNRYALDGRLLATYELPESTDRNDQMTLVGPQLLLKIRGALYSLRLDAEPNSKPVRIAGRADAMSSSSWDGKVAICDANELFWFDPATEQRTLIVRLDTGVTWLHVDQDGTIFGFGGGNVHAWRSGQVLEGFPKGFNAERPQKIGKFWYGHGWHGTIHRMNAAFEPEPGVVLGGASGSFIGYLPQSADITNGRGLVHVRDQLFAVSGLAGVVQLLEWREDDSRFEVVRRIGPVHGLKSLALDAEGNIWTPRGTWRWSDSAETPLTLGDVEPSLNAQPVVLGGRTLCLLKKHYSYVQLARGPLIDASGWSHLETDGVKDLEFSESITGAAAFPDAGGRLIKIVTERNGKAIEFPVSPAGRMAGPVRSSTIPGLTDCTSLAWFDGKLLAADGGDVIVFERTASQDWHEVSRLRAFGDEVYIHSDGRRLAVSDTENNRLDLYDSLGTKAASYGDLNKPQHVAVSGDRVVVYDAGNQRLVKLERAEAAVASGRLATRWQTVSPSSPATFTDADYLELSRPGGIPCHIALSESPAGLAVSVRTGAPEMTLGIANGKDAFVLTGRRDAHLPPGDWSQLRLAASLATPAQRERIGFLDHRAIHAPFSDNPDDWAPFDLANYRELVAERKQQIRIEFEQPLDGKATLVIEDDAGNRVRNLLSGRSFAPGKQAVVWDGLDEAGRLVAPGTYRWRGVTHPGIEPAYKMNFANGGEPTIQPWGTNHGLLHHAVARGELIFFAAPVTEGGWALLALDADGNFVQGYEHQQGFGIGHNAIAADDRFLYCAQDGFGWGGTRGIDFGSDRWTATWTLTVARYDIKTGKVVEYPGNKRAFEADTMEIGPGSKHPDLSRYNLGGLAVLDGKLYVGSRGKDAVLVFEAATGEPLNSIPLNGVRHLTASDDVFAATDQGVVRLSDRKLLVPAGDMDIAGIAIAPSGDIVLSDRNSHQVHRFDAEGKYLAALGAPGGPYRGVYDRQRMVNPAGLAFGPDGKLWVTETRWNPKRILAWDLAKNQVVYEKFGMPHYGGDGSGFDPQNPRRWIGLGCFWDVDLEAGTARPTHIMAIDEGHFEHYHPHSYSFFREAGRTFLCTRGKIALISEVLDDGTIRDIAAAAGTHHFAYGCGWQPPQAYIDAFYAKWPGKRANEKPGRGGQGKPWAERVAGVLWVDRNADGLPQQDEFDFCEEGIKFADGAWGHQQTSLTFHFPAVVGEQTKVVAIRPDGFLPNGIPDYPTLNEAIARGTDVGLTPGYKRNGVATVRDRFGRFVFNSDPEMNAYHVGESLRDSQPVSERPDHVEGRHLWSYPNRWSDVHGSHNAPLPETGVMQGTLGILGIASFDDQADVIFLNGNHGRCFLLTSDGLYLDEVFSDVRVSYLKNEYRLGGEIFGGMFGRSEPDGKYYVQIGHGPYRIYELAGIREARRMSGEASVSPEQIVAAERRNRRQLADRQTEKKFRIPGTVSWDQSGKFKAELTAAVEGEHLHLIWRVQDSSPWINNGRDWTTLFATGDTVDLQIGVDAGADPKRRGPVVGDKRLMIAPYEGKPIAVLYEHRKPGGQNPIEFTSPWRGEKVDDVRQLPEVQIEVKTSARDYTVDAKIPLAALNLKITGQPLRADFGVTFGDAGGTETQLRSYWSNPATMLVDDIPGEIMLHPNLWGEVRFQAD